MASSGGLPSNQGTVPPNNSSKESNRWTTLKSGLVLGLKATEMALDGLPIPGAKGCVGLILHIVNTIDLTVSNAEALEALQNRLDSLQEILSPVYANRGSDVSSDVRQDVGNLAVKLDQLAAKWRPKLVKKQRKRDIIRRMFNAEDDRDNLTKFANSVEQAIQDFLAISTTNGRIAASREEVKNQEARTLVTLQLLPRATAASYNCIRTGGANVCLKGTRVSILDVIRTWATNRDPDQPPIFWLNGLAGIGKTTIAHTIASELDAKGLLGASFVFLRADDELKDARLVFPTLAFQLARYNSHFRAALVQVLERDPDCGSNSLDLQFEKLILKPFLAASLSTPVIIILDALDECGPERLTSELLWILHGNVRSTPFLRVFITSRPEGYIREALDLVDSTSPHQKLVLHEEIHAQTTENDIRLFLQSCLQKIWDERTKQTFVRWPSERDVEKLVQQSGKLFVYAATAVRFIGGDRTLNLKRQLSALLCVKIGHIPQGEPYWQLDGLYLQILGSVFATSTDEYYVHRFRKIVGSIVVLERPLPLGALANFLGDYSVEEIEETLYHLHSIIVVPVALSEAPRTYHLSFPNFITNSDRCTNPKAYIDPRLQAKYLFDRCLTVMEKDFGPTSVPVIPVIKDVNQHPFQPRNARADVHTQTIDTDEESSTDSDSQSNRSDSDISLENNGENHDLPPAIRYSDNYWYRHLVNIPTSNQAAALSLERFILQYLPQWLQRRTSRITGIFEKPNIKLAGDTFDILHGAHRWGSRAGCSHEFKVFVQQSAARLYAQIFPDAYGQYVFGKRNVPLTVPSNENDDLPGNNIGRGRDFSAPGSSTPLGQSAAAAGWGNENYHSALPPLTVASDPPLSYQNSIYFTHFYSSPRLPDTSYAPPLFSMPMQGEHSASSLSPDSRPTTGYNSLYSSHSHSLRLLNIPRAPGLFSMPMQGEHSASSLSPDSRPTVTGYIS